MATLNQLEQAELAQLEREFATHTRSGLTATERAELEQLEGEFAAHQGKKPRRFQATAPDGRTVVIEGDGEPTEGDLEELFSSLPADSAAKPARKPTAEEIGEIRPYKQETGIMRRIRESLSPLVGQTAVQRAIQEAKNRAVGAEGRPQTWQERGALPAVTSALRQPAALAARVGGSLLAAPGGPGGALAGGASELAGQVVGGEGLDKGRIAQASAVSAIPLSQAAGVLAKLGNAVRMGGAGYAGEHVRTLVNEGELSDEAAKAGTVGGAISLGSSALGKVAALANRLRGGRSPLPAGASVRDRTLAEAQEAGYVVEPYAVNDSALNRALGSIAGKAHTGQSASLANQKTTNRLAAQALGLEPGTEITPAVLKEVRQEAGAAYRELDDLSRQSRENLTQLQKARTVSSDPHEMAVLQADPANKVLTDTLMRRASADINELGIARDNARDAWKDYRIHGGVERRVKAQAYSDQVERLESNLDKAAASYGRPELADNLRAGRERIAKAYNVDAALNLGDANVSAPLLGRALDRGAPLTGELATIAKFQQAFPKNAVEGASVPAPGVGKLSAGLGALLGTGVAMGTRDPLLAAGAVVAPEALSQAARRIMLSDVGQRVLTRPVHGDSELSNAMARVIEAVTRQRHQEALAGQ